MIPSEIFFIWQSYHGENKNDLDSISFPCVKYKPGVHKGEDILHVIQL